MLKQCLQASWSVTLRIGLFFQWTHIRGYAVSYGCMAPNHECLFTRIGLWLRFIDFEVFVFKNLKISPPQFHPSSWDYMRVFHLCIEHKSCKPLLILFFNLLYLVCTSHYNYR